MAIQVIDESTQNLTNLESSNKHLKIVNYIWDIDSLSWVKQSSVSGGTGEAVTVTNFPAVFPISDNGGSITVDGSITVLNDVASDQSVQDTTAAVNLVKTAVDNVNTTLQSGTIFVDTNKTTEHTFTQAGVIPINTDLLIINCSDYGSISIQITSMGTAGVITPSWSNDGIVFNTAGLGTPSGGVATSMNTANIWRSEICGKYLRLRLTTATTGGTTSIVVNGRQAVVAASAQSVIAGASSSLIGDISTQYRASSTGAASGYHIVSLATTNPAIIKASAGRVVGWTIANTSMLWRFVKLHNQSTSPTAGVSVFRTIPIAPGAVLTQSLPGGIAFTSGIAITIVNGANDSDATAVGANEVVGDIYFA